MDWQEKMNIDWLLKNSKESNGFVASRVVMVTYQAICIMFGTAFIKDHGRTIEGISIGQILTPTDVLKR